MFAKLSSLSLLAGLVTLSLSSVAFAGGGGDPTPPAGEVGAYLDCDVVAGADVNANCEVDITKATLHAAVTASCSVPAGGDGSVLDVDVDELFASCKADASLTAFLSSTLNAALDCKAALAADLKADLKAEIDATIKALVDQGKLSVEAAASLLALVHAQIDVAAAAQCDANFGLSALLNLEARLKAFCEARADAQVQVLNLLRCDVDACLALAVKASAACEASVEAGASLQCSGALVLGVDIDLALDLDLDGDVDVGLDILSPDKAQFANGFLNVDANVDGVVDVKLPVAISAVAGVSANLSTPQTSASIDVDGDGSVDLTIELDADVKLDLDLDVDVSIDASLCAAVNASADVKAGVSALGLDLNADGTIDAGVGVKVVSVSGSGSLPLPAAPNAPPANEATGDASAPEASSSDGGCSTAPGKATSNLSGALLFGSVFALLGARRRRTRKLGRLPGEPPRPLPTPHLPLPVPPGVPRRPSSPTARGPLSFAPPSARHGEVASVGDRVRDTTPDRRYLVERKPYASIQAPGKRGPPLTPERTVFLIW